MWTLGSKNPNPAQIRELIRYIRNKRLTDPLFNGFSTLSHLKLESWRHILFSSLRRKVRNYQFKIFIHPASIRHRVSKQIGRVICTRFCNFIKYQDARGLISRSTRVSNSGFGGLRDLRFRNIPRVFRIMQQLRRQNVRVPVYLSFETYQLLTRFPQTLDYLSSQLTQVRLIRFTDRKTNQTAAQKWLEPIIFSKRVDECGIFFSINSIKIHGYIRNSRFLYNIPSM